MRPALAPGWLLHVGPAVVYAATLLALGLMRSTSVPTPAANDKVLHAFAFLVMTLLAWRAVRFVAPALPPGRAGLVAAGLAVALGGLLEIAQAFTGYRAAEWLDLVADAAGALVGAGIAGLIGWWGEKHPTSG